MNLVQCIDTVTNKYTTLFEQYCDVFEGLGCVTNVSYHIRIDPTKTPVIHPPRHVPITLRPKIQEELARMERLNVVEKVTEPTNWVNSMVTIIKPNGSLRICIDPRHLNEAIQQEHYPIQTIEEVTARMPEATYSQFLMLAQATGRSALTKRAPNCAHLTAHLAATCLNAFHLAYHLLKTYSKSDERNVRRY